MEHPHLARGQNHRKAASEDRCQRPDQRSLWADKDAAPENKFGSL